MVERRREFEFELQKSKRVTSRVVSPSSCFMMRAVLQFLATVSAVFRLWDSFDQRRFVPIPP